MERGGEFVTAREGRMEVRDRGSCYFADIQEIRYNKQHIRFEE
jgi:hypothetical protein